MLVTVPAVIPVLVTFQEDLPATGTRDIDFVTKISRENQLLVVRIHYLLFVLFLFFLLLNELYLRRLPQPPIKLRLLVPAQHLVHHNVDANVFLDLLFEDVVWIILFGILIRRVLLQPRQFVVRPLPGKLLVAWHLAEVNIIVREEVAVCSFNEELHDAVCDLVAIKVDGADRF